MTTPVPVRITRRETEPGRPAAIAIAWSDGATAVYSPRLLRDACPCATCREQRKEPPQPSGGLTVLSMAEARPLTVQGMKPVGNYAYSIAFSDGHDTGIFTLDLLRALGTEVSASE